MYRKNIHIIYLSLWGQFLPCHKNVYELWYLNYTKSFEMIYCIYESLKSSNSYAL